MTTHSSDNFENSQTPLTFLATVFKRKGALIAICGADGTGKTTVANELSQYLSNEGIETCIVHSYGWARNLFIMPFVLAGLRGNGQIVILDRTLWDNVIVTLCRVKTPMALRSVIIQLAQWLRPRFDHKICLTAPSHLIQQRRPEELHQSTLRKLENYSLLCTKVGFSQFDSSTPIINQIICDMALKEGFSPTPPLKTSATERLA